MKKLYIYRYDLLVKWHKKIHNRIHTYIYKLECTILYTPGFSFGCAHFGFFFLFLFFSFSSFGPYNIGLAIYRHKSSSAYHKIYNSIPNVTYISLISPCDFFLHYITYIFNNFSTLFTYVRSSYTRRIYCVPLLARK